MVRNKDNRVFMSRNYRLIVAPWKFDVLKTSIFVLEASLLGKIFPRGNYGDGNGESQSQ